MKAGRYDFTVPRGEEFAKDFTRYSDRAQTKAFDYTGWSAELIIDNALTLKVGAGLRIEGNRISISMTKVQTESRPNFQRDHYKLRLINPAGEDSTLLQGWVTWQTQ